MNKNKNCPNCGAPYDTQYNKCPYCGTSYFDMSCIDFTSHEPIFLKIKVLTSEGDAYIIQKVIPKLGSIEMSAETVDVADSRGRKLCSLPRSCSTFTNIELQGVPIDEKRIFIMEIEK